MEHNTKCGENQVVVINLIWIKLIYSLHIFIILITAGVSSVPSCSSCLRCSSPVTSPVSGRLLWLTNLTTPKFFLWSNVFSSSGLYYFSMYSVAVLLWWVAIIEWNGLHCAEESSITDSFGKLWNEKKALKEDMQVSLPSSLPLLPPPSLLLPPPSLGTHTDILVH